MDGAELVKRYLRGKNLEQLGRLDDAVVEYEAVIAERFDATGPYDRLIAIYAHQARHRDVIRVAGAALDRVRTHDSKIAYYERVRLEARRALAEVPSPLPRRSD